MSFIETRVVMKCPVPDCDSYDVTYTGFSGEDFQLYDLDEDPTCYVLCRYHDGSKEEEDW